MWGKQPSWVLACSRQSYFLKMAISNDSLRKTGYVTLMGSYLEWHPKVGTAVCGTARTVVWEVGECESRR